MESFREYLGEGFTSPYEWKWSPGRKDHATFITEKNQRVNVDFSNLKKLSEHFWLNYDDAKGFDVDAPAVDIAFNVAGRVRITGTGGAFRIFSTILEIIKEWEKQTNVKYAVFSSSDPSRTSLYKKLASKFGRKFSTLPDPTTFGTTNFIVTL